MTIPTKREVLAAPETVPFMLGRSNVCALEAKIKEKKARSVTRFQSEHRDISDAATVNAELFFKERFSVLMNISLTPKKIKS